MQKIIQQKKNIIGAQKYSTIVPFLEIIAFQNGVSIKSWAMEKKIKNVLVKSLIYN